VNYFFVLVADRDSRLLNEPSHSGGREETGMFAAATAREKLVLAEEVNKRIDYTETNKRIVGCARARVREEKSQERERERKRRADGGRLLRKK